MRNLLQRQHVSTLPIELTHVGRMMERLFESMLVESLRTLLRIQRILRDELKERIDRTTSGPSGILRFPGCERHQRIASTGDCITGGESERSSSFFLDAPRCGPALLNEFAEFELVE